MVEVYVTDFQNWLGTLKENIGWLAMPKNAIVRSRHLETLLRMAWDAGVESTQPTRAEGD